MDPELALSIKVIFIGAVVYLLCLGAVFVAVVRRMAREGIYHQFSFSGDTVLLYRIVDGKRVPV